MLSIKKLSSAKGASHYFEKDDYYAKDSDEAKKDSQWAGRAAGTLGLSGTIDPAKFKQLLEGRLDGITQLGRENGDGQSHVPGWDLTFSAPKSVSLLYEVGGDQRLKDAHLNAVKNTLSYIEKNKLVTRQMVNGVVKMVPTQNMLSAVFTHHTSRSLDPQLHSHAVILNMTQNHAGDWRSVESLPIYRSKMFLGSLYRAELARSVKALGYEIEQTHSDGRFSIMGVPKNVLREFSGRRQAIEEGLKNSHNPDALAAERVALLTRKYKSEQSHIQLKKDWDERSKALGFDPKVLVNAANKTIVLSPTEREKLADEAIAYAASKQSERESVFNKEALIVDALIHSMGDISLIDVVQAIERNKSGTLVKTELDGEAAFTTKRAIYLEKANIAMVRDGNHTVKAIAEKQEITDFLTALAKSPHQSKSLDAMIKNNPAIAGKPQVIESLKNYSLTPGQVDAINHILTTNHRIVGIQGYAGVGKTFMLEQAKDIAKSQQADVRGIVDYVRSIAGFQNYTVHGFAPSASASKTLGTESGIPSMTLARHLMNNKGLLEGKNKKGEDFSRQIWVVDESSMISNKDMFDLLKISELSGARVVLIGDKQQLGAVEAGKPFSYLQESTLSVVSMKDILRQQVSSLLSSVYDTIKGKFQSAFRRIESNIVEIENRDARLEAIAKEYLNSPDRENMLVVAPFVDDRMALSDLIRRGLKRGGTLLGQGHMHDVLVKQGFTSAEKSRVSSYRIGMILRFNRAFKTHSIQENEHLQVVGMDVREGVLFLRRENGDEIRFNISRHGASRGLIEVSVRDVREVNKGDVLLWKNNEKRLGLNNGDKLTVLDVNEKQLRVKDENGNEKKIKPNKTHHQYFDYHYTASVNRSQGMTYDSTLMHGEDYRRNLTNQKSFYVGLSRAKHQFKLFVNNKEKFAKAVEKNRGEKTSALKSLNRYKGGRNELVPLASRPEKQPSKVPVKRTVVKTR